MGTRALHPRVRLGALLAVACLLCDACGDAGLATSAADALADEGKTANSQARARRGAQTPAASRPTPKPDDAVPYVWPTRDLAH